MISTSEKLKNEAMEMCSSFFNPAIKEQINNFKLNELFETNYPSRHLKSLYLDNSFGKDLENSNDKIENDKRKKYVLRMYYLYKLI